MRNNMSLLLEEAAKQWPKQVERERERCKSAGKMQQVAWHQWVSEDEETFVEEMNSLSLAQMIRRHTISCRCNMRTFEEDVECLRRPLFTDRRRGQ